ncbi:MAG: lamin tail domain-containing protein, partial [Chitinophagaceae bacterium]
MRKFVVVLAALFCFADSSAQTSGRVVINEYMPWTLNGCGATAEFVELLNFGPGPINIGCYVLTDGDFSITIPPNTILQPGEFYLIAGQSVIPAPCANIDSTVTADLNWNTCGCTSAPIPTTGDGFFTDGGSANEQVVLLDPGLKIVDAVVRGLPTEPSWPVTPASVGGCSIPSFDLDTMSINYEVLGMSTGRGNSFARKLDGDCGWVKDPQQSGNATNNTPGETSNVTYDFTIVQAMDCDANHGSIDIYVNVGSSVDVFPMNYTIAFDANGDGLFDFTDTYTQGVDSTPPSIAILGLPYGRYRVTVSSSKGCFLRTFDFTILDCTGLLATQLDYFNLLVTKNGLHTFEWLVPSLEDVQEITVEGSLGVSFITVATILPQGFSGTKKFTKTVATGYHFYRIRVLARGGKISYSKIIAVGEEELLFSGLYPNPTSDFINLQFVSKKSGRIHYQLYDALGVLSSWNRESIT